MAGNIVHDGNDLLAIGDVEQPGLCATAVCDDLIGDGLRALGREVGHGDISALSREHARGGAAHAAGGSRDEHGQSFHRPAELLEIGHLALA